jgi:hypothetical protein
MSQPPLKGNDFKVENAHFGNLKVRAQEDPGLTLQISEGAFWTSRKEFVQYAGGNSPALTIPSVNPKWVLVALADNGNMVLVDGTEAVDPVFPDLPISRIPLAAVYLQTSDTEITDDMVFDVRPDFHLSLNASEISASISALASNVTVLLASATAHHQSISVLNTILLQSGSSITITGGSVEIDTTTVFNITASGTQVATFDLPNPGGSGLTSLMLWDVDTGTLQRVTVGADDSGGVGFKALRIPN